MARDLCLCDTFLLLFVYEETFAGVVNTSETQLMNPSSRLLPLSWRIEKEPAQNN